MDLVPLSVEQYLLSTELTCLQWVCAQPGFQIKVFSAVQVASFLTK